MATFEEFCDGDAPRRPNDQISIAAMPACGAPHIAEVIKRFNVLRIFVEARFAVGFERAQGLLVVPR
jgi:hypothetical protein